jgi:threonine/homoserine/homoserine lactone efflux protein
MWFLNFFAPFLYDTSGTPQTIRYILHITLIIEFVVYIAFIAKYKLFGCTSHLLRKDQREGRDRRG